MWDKRSPDSPLVLVRTRTMTGTSNSTLADWAFDIFLWVINLSLLWEWQVGDRRGVGWWWGEVPYIS